MAKNSREDFLKIEGVQEKLELIAKNNEFTIDELLSVIEKESSFDHTAKNKNSSATGLIQFMADTAKGLGTTTKALGSMTVLDQLDYVDKYFQKNHKKGTHPYQTVALPVSKHFNYNEAITGDSLHKKLPKTYPSVEKADKAINKWKAANPVWVNKKTNELTPASIVAYGGTSLNTDIVKGKQQQMKDAGIDIIVDGVWGPDSRSAWTEFSDPNKKKKVEGPVFTGSMTPTDQEGRPITAEGVGPQAGQTGRSKKGDVQVSAIERLPVEKIDIEKSKEVTNVADVENVDGDNEKNVLKLDANGNSIEVQSELDKEAKLLPNDGDINLQGAETDQTNDLVSSIDGKKVNQINVKEQVAVPGAKNILSTEGSSTLNDEDFNFNTLKFKGVDLTSRTGSTERVDKELDLNAITNKNKAANPSGTGDVVSQENIDKLKDEEFYKYDDEERALNDPDDDDSELLKKIKRKETVGGKDNFETEDFVNAPKKKVEEEVTPGKSFDKGGITDFLDIPFTEKEKKEAAWDLKNYNQGDAYLSQKQFNKNRKEEYVSGGNVSALENDAAYQRNLKEIEVADRVYEEIVNFSASDIKGGFVKQMFTGLGNQTLDFGKFSEQMKVEMLNLIPKEKWQEIADGRKIEDVLGGDKESIIHAAKTQVLGVNAQLHKSLGLKLKSSTDIQQVDEENHFQNIENLRADYDDVNGQVFNINSKYGGYRWDARGRKIFIPKILNGQNITFSKTDIKQLEGLNGNIKNLDLRRADLNKNGATLKESREFLNKKVGAYQKSYGEAWTSLAWDMALPLDRQPPSFKGTVLSEAWDQSMVKLTDNPLFATMELGGIFGEEYYRYRTLAKMLSKWQVWVGAGIGYGAAAVADAADPDKGDGITDSFKGYSYKDQYLDFLGSVANFRVTPRNNKENLFTREKVNTGSFLGDLFDGRAYDASFYSITKTIAELLPYTLNIARAGKGVKAIVERQNKIISNAQRGTGGHFPKGHSHHANLGNELIKGISRFYKPNEKAIQGTRMVGMNHRMLILDNLADARANGLSGEDALYYANLTTLATGISQLVMPDANFFKDALGKNMLRSLINDIKKEGSKAVMKRLNKESYARVTKQFSTNFFKEHVEEQLDVVLNDVVKANFLADYSPEVMNVNTQREILVGTSLLTGTLGIGRAGSTIKNVKKAMYSAIHKEGSEILTGSAAEINELQAKLDEYTKKSKKYPNNRNFAKKKEVFEEALKREQDASTSVRNVMQALNAAPKYATVEMIDNLIKKNDLLKEKKELLKKDKAANSPEINKINEKIKSIDEQIIKDNPTEWKKNLYTMSLTRGVKLLESAGIDVNLLELNQDEYSKQIQERNSEIDLINEKRREEGKPEIKPLDDGGNAQVIYDDYGKKPVIIINKDSAKGKGDNYGVGVHEVFHLVLQETIKKSPKKIKGLAFLLRKELLENPEKYKFQDRFGYVVQNDGKDKNVGGKFKSYEDQVGSMEWDEMFTVLSEGLAQGDVKIDSNALTKIGDFIRRLFRGMGMERLSIGGRFADPAKGMLNFIRDYNKELLGNKPDFSKGMRGIIKNGLKFDIDQEYIKAAEAEEKQKKMPEWGGMRFASASTRGGRLRRKNIYERNDVKQDIKLSENTQKIVDENERIRQELLNTRRELDDGSFEYDEDLRNDLVLNNMALVTALSDFAAKNPKIMGLEKNKKVGFEGFRSGFSKELINLSRTYDPALTPFGAYLNMLLPLRFGDALKGEQRGAMEGSVSIDNEQVGEIADESVPSDFDNAPRFVAPKYNVAKEIGVEEEVEKEISDGLSELKQLKKLIKEETQSGETIQELKENLKEKHMLDLDLDTLELSSVEGLTYKTIARESGVDVEKLNPRSSKFLANLRKKEGKAGSNEVRTAQRFIARKMQLILSTIFNEGHTKAFKSTNMPNVLLRFGYNKGSKRIGNSYPQYKKPNLSERDFAEYLGIFRVSRDGKKGYEFKVDRNTSAKLTAVLSLLDRTITNQSLRRSLEATGDLNERLKNSLEDGLAASAQSVVFMRQTKEVQQGVKQRLPELAIDLEQVDPEISQAKMITQLSKIFTRDGLMSVKEAKALLNDMFRESGVIKQYQYVEGNLKSQGIVMIPFEEFADKYMEAEVYVGLIAKYGLKKPVYNEQGKIIGEETPSQKEVFDTKAVKRGRNIIADFVVDNIVRRQQNGEITMKEALEEIAMLEQEQTTAYKIGDGSRIFKAGTNTAVKQKGEGSGRFQLFMSKEGPKADFRKFIFKAMPQEFIESMPEGVESIFREGKSDSFVDIKFEGQDGKGVITQMINVIKNVTRKGANKYSQLTKNKEAELARKVLTNKIIYLSDRLNAGEITEHDFVVQMMTLMSNPTTTLRRAGKVVGIMDGILDKDGNFLLGDKVSNSDIRFEHQKPASYLLMKILDITSDKNVDRDDWSELVKKELVDYNVAIITKKADDTLDRTGRKNLMGLEYESGQEYGSMSRMFNEMNKGDKNVKPIRLIDDVVNNREGKVFGLGHDIAGDLLQKPMVEIKKDQKRSKVTQSANSVNYNRSPRGMSAFDFDETVGISDNFVIATKNGETKRIASDEWPMVGDQLVKEGWKMDFSDFNKVTNGKPGPLMQKMKNQIKKFGPKNVFILTARAPESQAAIHAYLESEGIKIPIENITGLGNSTGEAKALWMLDKFAEGYNDMYFVDDALPNVKAVKNVLEQLDIKSKVQIALSQKSIDYNRKFNKIIEENEGVDADKRFSKAKAGKRGQENNKFKIFIPPSAEDFVGLLYNFLGKGKIGEEQFEFFKEALLGPLNRAYKALNEAKQNIANGYKVLSKRMPEVTKKLNKIIEGGDYTYGDAIRVYLWDKSGLMIPGLSKTDQAKLVAIVKSDESLKAFAENLEVLAMQEDGYVKPSDEWLVGDIKTDLMNAAQGVNRKIFFKEFLENVSIIFSEENLNKIEATYGTNFREALEDMLYRIENGTNRNFGTQNRLVNRFMNWLNGAIGTTMFFNARSALLQTLSTVNFINWEDNNILSAAKAFANQKQFWADFTMLFNSDMLLQRRSGLGMDINANELAQYVANASGSMAKYKAALNFLLSKGFLPTQIADSFAIAAGGATFYRNRYKKYLAEGMTVDQAKEKAFEDFQAIAEETQQSARPDMISQQQASVLGRLILAFQNTPMQYTRLMKKAILDLVNGRGDAKSHVSRIIYYGAVQNLIFYSLQTALFAMMFDDDDEDEEFFDKKKGRILSGTIDSTLRGMGVGGAVISTLKNMTIAFYKEQQKNYNKDESAVIMELANLSPPIGIKLRKIRQGERAIQWNKDLIEEMPYYNLKNPAWEAAFAFTQAGTNIPLSRLHTKVTNMSDAFREDLEGWQRLALMMGWSKWNIGVGESKSSKRRKRKTRSAI